MRQVTRQEMASHLKIGFAKVRQFLLTEGLQKTELVRQNPRKNDETRGFDYLAEGIFIEHLRSLKIPMRILTEERGEVKVGRGNAIYTVMVDPVDGSTNYKRKIESTAFSAALLEASSPISPSNVCIALIGSVWSGNVFHAIAGEGAFYNDQMAHGSSIEKVERALIGMDLDFNKGERWKWGRVDPLIEVCNMIRRGGSAALDAAYVSTSSYDAIVDVRDKSTPENFMAAYLLIKEAGGSLTDPFGNEIGSTEDLSKMHNWVASGNPRLHENILKLLDMAAKP